MRQAAILLGAAGTIFFLVYALAGVLVDACADWIPYSWERAMSRHYAAHFPVDLSEKHTRRLQRLLDTLTPHMEGEDANLRYSVRVSDDDTVNAVALPGGDIVFYTGLLDELKSDDEVLFVLAHELGHFHHRDHLRRMGRGLISALMHLALAGAGHDGSAAVMQAVTGSMTLGYSRGQERAADLYAVNLLHRATGSAAGAADFMSRLETMLQDHKFMLYFFRTHPDPAERRAYIEEAVQGLQ